MMPCFCEAVRALLVPSEGLGASDKGGAKAARFPTTTQRRPSNQHDSLKLDAAGNPSPETLQRSQHGFNTRLLTKAGLCWAG